jgi:phosphatidylinositol alpha-1,6-mannosyltransferase
MAADAHDFSMIDDNTRVLVLTPAIDGADGISALSRQVVASLARAARASRLEVWTLDGAFPRELASSGIDCWSAGGSRIAIVRRAMARAARRSDDLHVIVLHVHLAPLASLIGRRGASITVCLIGIEVWTALRARERRAVERADRLVAISQFTARGFREANPALAGRAIAVCAPGIGAAPSPRDPDVDDGFALIVGRLSSAERYKGHEALIGAWPAVRAAIADARLLVVGDGDDRGRLEGIVAERGLGDAITFLGRVDDAVLAALYARASFFVMPSPREGFGLVYLEAMRAGKPCIAVHGSADEIIRHGVDGLVIDAGSTDGLAAAIVRLFADGDARARMGAAARARVQESFTEEQFSRRLIEALELRSVPEGAVPAMR